MTKWQESRRFDLLGPIYRPSTDNLLVWRCQKLCDCGVQVTAILRLLGYVAVEIECSRHLYHLGKIMKKIALAAAALVIGTASASAADLAARPYVKAPAPIAVVYNWTGFYIGAQVGYAWGDNSTREFVTVTGLPTGFNQGFNTDGFVGGGHLGYNWQFGQFVFGLEGDIEGADINGGAV